MTEDQKLRVELSQLKKKISEFERKLNWYLDRDMVRRLRLIKREEAAELLDCHPRTIERMVERREINKYNSDGTLKVTNHKTAVYYDKKEIMEWKH